MMSRFEVWNFYIDNLMLCWDIIILIIYIFYNSNMNESKNKKATNDKF